MNPHNNECDEKETTHNTNLIGFITIREVYSNEKEKSYIIPLLCVRKELRNMGYGTLLLQEAQKMLVERTYKTITLYLHALPKSVNFYKSHGFYETNDSKYIERVERIEENDVLLCKIF
jgi:ribosomal protein S18 acetylase RimI-like enzyme